MVNKLLQVALTALVLFALQKKHTDWKALVPLVTTRTQVEANLGAPISGKGYVLVYETPNEKLSVWYGGARSSDTDLCRWNVPNETLFKFVLAPKTRVRLAEMNVDLAAFRKQKALEMVNDYYYYNENDGVTITTRIIEGEEVLLNIERGPDSVQREKYCCKKGAGC